MKKFFNHKKKIFIITLSVAICGTLFVGKTLAYLFDYAGPVTNEFTLTSLHTEIDEEITETTLKKAPIVINTDVEDALVRMRYTITPEDKFKENFGLNGIDGKYIKIDDNSEIKEWKADNWKWGLQCDSEEYDNGFYYYQEVLKAENITNSDETTPLFTHILKKDADGSYSKIDNEDEDTLKKLDGVEITLYQESIPTKAIINGELVNAVNDNGTINQENAIKLWKNFDNQDFK